MSVELISGKDELHAKLIKAETKLINVEADMKEMRADYDNKISTLEATVVAKDFHIHQLVF